MKRQLERDRVRHHLADVLNVTDLGDDARSVRWITGMGSYAHYDKAAAKIVVSRERLGALQHVVHHASNHLPRFAFTVAAAHALGLVGLLTAGCHAEPTGDAHDELRREGQGGRIEDEGAARPSASPAPPAPSRSVPSPHRPPPIAFPRVD